MRQTQEQPTREKALVEVLVVTKKCEQGGQPERRIGRFIKSQSLGRRRVTFTYYEVLGLASDGRHCLMIFLFGPTFFLVRVLDADCGDDGCSLILCG